MVAVQKELRILMLEDVTSDAVMINHELRRGGLAFSAKRVDNKEQFLHELQHHPPDIILSDHGLPDFDGFTALAIAQGKCPDVPFIFVTGSLGEEAAIEIIKSGATDYVLKNRIAVNLVPAVQQALRASEDRKSRHEAERALRESEERFRMLVEGVKDYAVFMLDVEGRVTSWNSGAEWIHGYRANEIIGQHVSCFYIPVDIKQGLLVQHLESATHDGRCEVEGWRLRKGGKQFWADVIITALRDDHGQLRGFAHVTCDITDRRRTLEALEKSEARKVSILETSLDAIISIDEEGRIHEWNPAAERIFGYARAHALNSLMDELIVPPSLRDVYHDRLSNYLITGVGSLLGRPIEMRSMRADKSEFPVELTITRVPGKGPAFYTCFIRDITTRKQVEEELRQSEEQYRMLVEGVADYAIYLLDTAGRIVTWNAGAEQIEGYSGDEFKGLPVASFYPAEDIKQGKPAQVLKTATNKGRCADEGWRVRKDGTRYWASIIYKALRDHEGKPCGFSEIVRDITARKQAEVEIHRLNEELEQRVTDRTAQLQAAYQEMEAFSYSISHDLRAPLRHIQGFVEVLQHNTTDIIVGENAQLLKTISESAKQMGRLIDDLLNFSRLGRVEMHKQIVSLAELVKAVRNDLAQETRARAVKWTVKPLPEAWADPSLLRQVLFNLLSNALKYTAPRKEANIEIGYEETEKEFEIFVRDNGVGFDMRYEGKLFGVFQRLHRAADFEGTGVGLANVKRIIQRHGGQVKAVGEVDKGATFYFSLPKLNGGKL